MLSCILLVVFSSCKLRILASRTKISRGNPGRSSLCDVTWTCSKHIMTPPAIYSVRSDNPIPWHRDEPKTLASCRSSAILLSLHVPLFRTIRRRWSWPLATAEGCKCVTSYFTEAPRATLHTARSYRLRDLNSERCRPAERPPWCSRFRTCTGDCTSRGPSGEWCRRRTTNGALTVTGR